MNVMYLHGFASSAHSTKAGWFGERLRAYGIELRCPDFNEPEFATMTLTRMITRLEQELADRDAPISLIGSSLGGTLAILGAARFKDRIGKMVLLAPAVMFAKPGHHLLPPDRIEEWAQRGTLSVFHHQDSAERPLNYSFYEDSLRYDAFGAEFTQATLIFQGLRDTSVDYQAVEQFARPRPNVTLSLVDDDHQLIASLPFMWDAMRDFLGLDR